jgi:4-hydroxy-2-oxoheptanedioate aldolase
MLTPTNRFKQALSRPAPQIGLWLSLADPYTAELCATAGFDWLAVDLEHAPNDLRSTLAILQALAGYDAAPVVRLPNASDTVIKQILELGATTVLVPMVESAAQAAQIVRACHYPPAGVRGVGSGSARSSRWSAYSDYLHAADEQVCVLVQIESGAGVEAVDAIAAVDGIDGVFVGAADLAASMGRLGEPAHPEVRAAVEHTLAAIQRAGKPAGALELNPALAERTLALGARFVAVGTDAALLASATRSLAARFRSADGSDS